jgi:hypothetical protein
MVWVTGRFLFSPRSSKGDIGKWERGKKEMIISLRGSCRRQKRPVRLEGERKG